MLACINSSILRNKIYRFWVKKNNLLIDVKGSLNMLQKDFNKHKTWDCFGCRTHVVQTNYRIFKPVILYKHWGSMLRANANAKKHLRYLQIPIFYMIDWTKLKQE